MAANKGINRAACKLSKLVEALSSEKDVNKVLIHKTPKRCFQGTDKFPRSSKYRGVSKNGQKWQVS